MANYVYTCSSCGYESLRSNVLVQHIQLCAPGAEVLRREALKNCFDSFFQNIGGISGETMRERAAYIYEASNVATIEHIKKGVWKANGPVTCFIKFITMCYGYRAKCANWRSVWLTNSHIHVKVDTRVEKYPRDDRHRIIVLNHMCDAYMWTITPDTMDMYIQGFNRTTDCAVEIFNTTSAWTEKVDHLAWTLKDLCSRKHFKSEVQNMLLSHFDNMFWYFSEDHLLRADPRLHFIPEDEARKAIERETTDTDQTSSLGPTGGRTVSRVQVIPEKYIKGFVCDCGQVSGSQSNMKRHVASCIGENYHHASFKLHTIEYLSPDAGIMQRTIPKHIEARIKVQNLMHRKPLVCDDDIVSMVDCDSDMQEDRAMLGSTQASIETFMTFFDMYFGKRLRPEYRLFWTVEHENDLFVVYNTDVFDAVASSVVVALLKDVWHDVFSIIWKEYKFQHTPERHEPSRFEVNGYFPPTFYEICEKFFVEGNSALTPVLEDLMTRVVDGMKRIR